MSSSHPKRFVGGQELQVDRLRALRPHAGRRAAWRVHKHVTPAASAQPDAAPLQHMCDGRTVRRPAAPRRPTKRTNGGNSDRAQRSTARAHRAGFLRRKSTSLRLTAPDVIGCNCRYNWKRKCLTGNCDRRRGIGTTPLKVRAAKGVLPFIFFYLI